MENQIFEDELLIPVVVFLVLTILFGISMTKQRNYVNRRIMANCDVSK